MYLYKVNIIHFQCSLLHSLLAISKAEIVKIPNLLVSAVARINK